MSLTPEEMESFNTDPIKMQSYILDYHERIMNGNYDIVDPTNPFMMLLEASCVTAAGSTINHINTLGKLYPRLGSKKEDTYRHLSDAELTNMFTVPAEAKIVFMINVANLKQYGYRPSGANYVTMTLPEYTEVTVSNTTFTLLNDINIILYDDNEIFVEQQISNLDIGVKDIGIIQPYINSGTDGVSWIMFETIVKQVKRRLFKDTIIIADGYNRKIQLTDQYFYSNVSYKNESTAGEYVAINKSHSDEYIDPYIPTIYINHNDTDVNYKIPDIYLVEKLITGNLNIELFETKGKLYLPINKYKIQDFIITLGNYGKSEAAAVSKNIMMLATSRYVVDGGMSEITYEELQNSIIYNTTGENDLPITDYEIKQRGKFNGFEVFKALDIITERLFIASKNISELTNDNTTTRADIFINTTKLMLNELPITDKIYTDNDIIIIKSGAVFKEEDYNVKLVSDYEINAINTLTNPEKEIYFTDKRYFITPFYYIIDKTDYVVNSRVYDMDQPVINSMKLVGKNNNMNARVNTAQGGIVTTTTGYTLAFTIVGNNDFGDIDPTKIFAQLAIPIANSNLMAYYTGQYDFNTQRITFTIDTDFYIDEDNNIILTNGDAIVSIIKTELTLNAVLHIYALDSDIIDDTGYLHSEMNFITSDTTVVFSKEIINITLGNNIEYIWNRVNNTYSDRMYQTYPIDVPLVYEKNVYDIDPNTNTIFDITKTVRSDKLTFTVVNDTTYALVLNSTDYSYLSDADATMDEIRDGLITEITDTNVSVVKTKREDNITIALANTFQYDVTINSVLYSYVSDSDATLVEIQDGLIAAITDVNVTVTATIDGINIIAIADGGDYTISVDPTNLTLSNISLADSLIITGISTIGDYSITVDDPNIVLTNISLYSTDLTYNLLHEAGDPVLDGLGNPINKYNAGDIVVDENNLPIVDQEGGVIRYIDILMVEYIYKLTTTKVGSNYYTNVIKWITDMLITSMEDLNKNTLENTKIVYKSYKSAKEVKVLINDNIHYFPYIVTPTVNLYSERGGYTEIELDNFKSTIGAIIHKHLDEGTISYANIRTEILDTLGREFVGVKLSGLSTTDDVEVFNMYDKTSRIIVGKQLVNDTNNNLIVKYMIDLQITKI